MRALVLAVVTSLLLAAPADAAGSVTVSPVDTSTPGQATGTVTTDAAYVRLRVVEDGFETIEPVVLETSQGGARFDLDTWGMERPTLMATGCDTTLADSCGAETRVEFTPTDVRPQVTWSDDEVVTKGETYDVTVSDPQGGGILTVRTEPCADRQQVEREGTTALTLWCGDGERRLVLERCQVDGYPCRATGDRVYVRVNREVDARFERLSRDLVAPDDDGPELAATYAVGEPASYRVDWQVLAWKTRAVVAEGRVDGARADGAGMVRFPVEVSEVPSGEYFVTGHLSYTETDGGEVSTELPASGTFEVDRDAPVVERREMTWRTFYPDTRDQYRNEVQWRVSVDEQATRTLRVLDAAGDLVRVSDDGISWGGHDEAGRLAPEGDYTLEVTFEDRVGHTTVDSTVVHLSHDHVVQRLMRATMTARESLLDTYVGSCSRIRTPAPGRRAGTLGLHTNTRCDATAWKRSAAVTVHGVRVPKALEYGTVRITTLSGAAPSMPGSRGFIEYWNDRVDAWQRHHVLPVRFTSHPGDEAPGGPLIDADRTLAWRTYTAYGAHYDLATFTVRLPYKVLVGPDESV